MKRIFLTAIVAAGLATAAQAGVDSGERAYLAGDYRMALDELLPLAREGDAEAQYIVGVMHDHGEGVARDYAAAASWYEKAAGQGHDLAAFSLGFMYYNGAGEGDNAVAQDIGKALVWLKRAAAADSPMAQALLAEIYYRGDVTRRNLVAAATLNLMAAEKGIAGARYSAALMLSNGEGVERDRVSAFAWFAVLAEKGYPGAARNRDIVAAVLGEEDLAAARAKAQELVAGE